ncbi:MAG: hypothetical protein JSU87_06675 [Gemmatimonadota bacterium]|nr:MAG: hypothetical protein JSU87_06675 [Gemmatimonadota bacterium]
MRRITLLIGLASALWCATSLYGQASIGVQGGWGDRFDWAVGGRFTYDLTPQLLPVAIIGSFDWYFPEALGPLDREYWEINTNAIYLQAAGQTVGYFGVGLNVANFSAEGSAAVESESDSQTEYGLNVLGGVRYKVGRVAPFFETRYTFESSKQLVIFVGLDLLLGSSW